ncbi:hypothetical protein KTO58_17100 [Chitinophaga pendula]|uniref:SecDF P1 head subdomain-containing protein n=1 Tax=Chitinophaga TaxID=79328 RepID=UPI000BB02031|nr:MULTISPECIES: hypothetical protein [Chitinophaga]ASZ11583.1 hypothetical protein CK934_11745 [Chitinophaga sp. MD30]UCJ05408.1 hypothetical protein KTO58_17100 [Chitinophaga pendula]
MLLYILVAGCGQQQRSAPVLDRFSVRWPKALRLQPAMQHVSKDSHHIQTRWVSGEGPMAGEQVSVVLRQTVKGLDSTGLRTVVARLYAQALKENSSAVPVYLEQREQGGYPYVLFKVEYDAASGERTPATLYYIMDGETSRHILSVTVPQPRLSLSTTLRWANIFKGRHFVPGQLNTVTYTLVASDGRSLTVAEQDSIRRVVLHRFGGTPVKIGPQDIHVQGDNVCITMRGRFDTLAARELLERNAGIVVLPVADSTGRWLQQADAVLRRQRLGVVSPLIIAEQGSWPAVSGWIHTEDTGRVLSLLRVALPAIGLTRRVSVQLGEADEGPAAWAMYLLDTSKVILGNQDIAGCVMVEGQDDASTMTLSLTVAGAGKLADHTREHIGRFMAVSVNGQVIAAVRIMDVSKGRHLAVSGDFAVASAGRLARQIAYPYPLALRVTGVAVR